MQDENTVTSEVVAAVEAPAAVVAAPPVTSGTSGSGQLINSGDAYIVALPMADGDGTGAFVSNITVSAVAMTGTSQLFITPAIPFQGV